MRSGASVHRVTRHRVTSTVYSTNVDLQRFECVPREAGRVRSYTVGRTSYVVDTSSYHDYKLGVAMSAFDFGT